MAIQSFYENLSIETEEQVQAILKAFDEADKRRYPHHMVKEADEALERGRKLLEEGYFDDIFGNISE